MVVMSPKHTERQWVGRHGGQAMHSSTATPLSDKTASSSIRHVVAAPASNTTGQRLAYLVVTTRSPLVVEKAA